MWKETWQQRMELCFIYFIMIQPLLDISAYIGLPISELVRVLAIGLGVIYLVKKKAKGFILYLSVIALFFITHFIINIYMKNPFSFFQETIYIVKTLYFPVIFFTYLLIVQTNLYYKKIIQQVTISMFLIAIVMVIAELTNTGKRSYDMLAKAGHSGWFYSGNELSAILAMGFSYVVIYMLKTKKQALKITLFFLLLLLSWSMMTVGTKVSYGALIIVLLTAFLWSMWNNWKIRSFHSSFPWLAIVAIFVIVITPYSAIGNNLNFSPNANKHMEIENEDDLTSDSSSDVPVNVLNGRGAFLTNSLQQFKEAPHLQQLFGMGRGGNNGEESKFIEMDFFDWFFSFGVIGFILLILPFIYISFRIFKTFHPKQLSNPTLLFIIISTCLGLGAAFVAGHVLSSPATSIYLALSLAFLVPLLKKEAMS